MRCARLILAAVAVLAAASAGCQSGGTRRPAGDAVTVSPDFAGSAEARDDLSFSTQRETGYACRQSLRGTNANPTRTVRAYFSYVQKGMESNSGTTKIEFPPGGRTTKVGCSWGQNWSTEWRLDRAEYVY
jgi:hypothetical protein